MFSGHVIWPTLRVRRRLEDNFDVCVVIQASSAFLDLDVAYFSAAKKNKKNVFCCYRCDYRILMCAATSNSIMRFADMSRLPGRHCFHEPPHPATPTNVDHHHTHIMVLPSCWRLWAEFTVIFSHCISASAVFFAAKGRKSILSFLFLYWWLRFFFYFKNKQKMYLSAVHWTHVFH